MSVFSYQPSFVPPPSYSRTKIQPPPYSKPSPPSRVSLPLSLNPINGIKSLTRAWTNSSSASSIVSIPLTSSPTPSITISPPASSHGPSPSDRDSPVSPVSIPPPTYAAIKTAPKPSSTPPAYTPSASPRSSTDASTNQRSGTSSVPHQQVLPSMSNGLACDYEDDDWETLRWREERRRDAEESKRREGEESGCCAWWWSVGASPLPWAAYYVF